MLIALTMCKEAHEEQCLPLLVCTMTQDPGLRGSQCQCHETDRMIQLTYCSAATHSWLLCGKTWGSRGCQLVSVTDKPLDHLKETGILLLLKPIHVSDAFSVRNKCKLFLDIICILLAHRGSQWAIPFHVWFSLFLYSINLVWISPWNICLNLFPLNIQAFQVR